MDTDGIDKVLDELVQQGLLRVANGKIPCAACGAQLWVFKFWTLTDGQWIGPGHLVRNECGHDSPVTRHRAEHLMANVEMPDAKV